jgi:hypothetical protein
MVKGQNGPEHRTGVIVSMETGANGHLQHGYVLLDDHLPGDGTYVGITPDTVIDVPAPKVKP